MKVCRRLCNVMSSKVFLRISLFFKVAVLYAHNQEISLLAQRVDFQVQQRASLCIFFYLDEVLVVGVILKKSGIP